MITFFVDQKLNHVDCLLLFGKSEIGRSAKQNMFFVQEMIETLRGVGLDIGEVKADDRYSTESVRAACERYGWQAVSRGPFDNDVRKSVRVNGDPVVCNFTAIFEWRRGAVRDNRPTVGGYILCQQMLCSDGSTKWKEVQVNNENA